MADANCQKYSLLVRFPLEIELCFALEVDAGVITVGSLELVRFIVDQYFVVVQVGQGGNQVCRLGEEVSGHFTLNDKRERLIINC